MGAWLQCLGAAHLRLLGARTDQSKAALALVLGLPSSGFPGLMSLAAQVDVGRRALHSSRAALAPGMQCTCVPNIDLIKCSP